MATLQVNIPKLNTSNSGNWASDIKYLLLEKNAWNIMNRTEDHPANTDDTTALKDYKSRACSTLTTIYLNRARILPFHRKYQETRECMVKTTIYFHPDNRARHMQLFSEILACQLGVDECIDLFAARIMRISEQLKAIKQHINETYLSFQLLRYLPPQFDGHVQSILQ